MSCNVRAPFEPPQQQQRSVGLDGLRGVAAMAVCLFHWEHYACGTSNDQQLFRLGLLGVELFFMISGFVILMVAMRETNVSRFLSKRAVRLYPAYLISVAMTAAYVLYTGKYSLGAVIANATMLHSFFAFPNITNPYWTLAFEITFYVGMALVLMVRRLHSIEVISVVVLLLGLAYRFTFPQAMTIDEDRPIAQLGFILIAPQFTPFFVAGMMVYRWRTGALGRFGMAALALALASTLLGRGDFAQISGATYFGMACLMTACLAFASSLVTRNAFIGAAAMIGQISYPLYLVHCTVANTALLFGPAVGASPLTCTLISIVSSFCLSWIIHTRVEVPLQSFCRSRFGAKMRDSMIVFGR